MIFAGYRKDLVLTFSEMGKMVFSWAKKLTEIWYLLITGKFLFWTFRWWEIRSFFQPKSWWKDDIYVVFLSFLWYSRTWEIWFFPQWHQFIIMISSLQPAHFCQVTIGVKCLFFTSFWIYVFPWIKFLIGIRIYLFLQKYLHFR